MRVLKVRRLSRTCLPPKFAYHAAMELRGERIVLREFQMSDWTAIHRVTSHTEVCRYQPWGPSTEEETRAYMQMVMQAVADGPRRDCTLAAELPDTGDDIGYASLWLRSTEFRCGEIGFFLHPDWWGQGLGDEIARLLLASAFDDFHLHRMYATCDPRNSGSARLLEKVGMSREGRLRHTMLIRDGWRDSDVYAILEHEWKTGPG